MKATDLKKMYPEIWGSVVGQVKDELCDEKISAKTVDRIAHNVAFVACEVHHDLVKK